MEEECRKDFDSLLLAKSSSNERKDQGFLPLKRIESEAEEEAEFSK